MKTGGKGIGLLRPEGSGLAMTRLLRSAEAELAMTRLLRPALLAGLAMTLETWFNS